MVYCNSEVEGNKDTNCAIVLYRLPIPQAVARHYILSVPCSSFSRFVGIAQIFFTDIEL